MNKERKKGLVPALRFPEFRDTIGWKNEPLDKIYSFKVTNSLSRDRLNYENGTVKNIHYGDIHTKFAALFDIEKELVPFINPTEPLGKIKKDCYCKEGDMVFADASEDLNDVGKSIEIVNINNKKLVSGLHTLLARQQGEKLIVGFGGYLFKSNRIREQFKKESQGAKVLGISARRMSKIDIAFPADKKEQQKIADCLSSLDELIAAHTKKYEALQFYKKGLMQNLFPAEGKTVPVLRFPEFRNAAEWERINLGELADIVTGKTPSTTEPELWTGDILFITPTDISEENKYQLNTQRKITKAKDIKILPIGSVVYTCIASIGKIAITTKASATNQQINSVIVKQKYNNEFIYYALSNLTPFIRSIPATSTLPIINKTEFSKLYVIVPTLHEQQKIADCLSSLDDLIGRTSEKIEDLKAHKKGLMQQLFPAMDEVAA